jgi:hypothetical protein
VLNADWITAVTVRAPVPVMFVPGFDCTMKFGGEAQWSFAPDVKLNV